MMRRVFCRYASYIVGALVLACCSNPNSAKLTRSGLNPEKFIDVKDGSATALFKLTNANGVEVCITNYGGRIVSLMVPDREGALRDIVLGFDSIQAYYPENNKTDFGAAIGRYANRINRGRFLLDGDSVRLSVNNGLHCLHGGETGWQYRVYDVISATDSTLVLMINSFDGDNGFPGNVKASVQYLLTADNKLNVRYWAETDKPTVINLTNHSYFNLGGDLTASVANQELMINADGFTPIDSTFMTTGEIAPVRDTPFDFTTAKPIGRDLACADEQIANGKGYDHNFVLNTRGDLTIPAIEAFSPQTGIKMTIFTSEPGVQLYSANFLDGSVVGKHNCAYPQHSAFILETQHYPDSPNKPQWPSVVLRPGETYTSNTIFAFAAE